MSMNGDINERSQPSGAISCGTLYVPNKHTVL